MLQRSVNLNQENAHKTPLRGQGPSYALHGAKTANAKHAFAPPQTAFKPLQTGQKRQALTTGRPNRVLGQKDGNRAAGSSSQQAQQFGSKGQRIPVSLLVGGLKPSQ